MGSLKGYATGGLVVSPSIAALSKPMGATAVINSQSHPAKMAGMLGLEEGLVFKHLNSSGFDKLLIQRISKDPARFRSVINAK